MSIKYSMYSIGMTAIPFTGNCPLRPGEIKLWPSVTDPHQALTAITGQSLDTVQQVMFSPQQMREQRSLEAILVF